LMKKLISTRRKWLMMSKMRMKMICDSFFIIKFNFKNN